MVLDGQREIPLSVGYRVEVRRHARKAKFIANHEMTYWRILLDKMNWAAPPMYRKDR